MTSPINWMYLRTDLDYADHKHYSGDTFSCRQSGGWFKSAKTIPISWVNDDYCDCEDGSDEPGNDHVPSLPYLVISSH